MTQEINKRKERFLGLAKKAGFENITQFAKSTKSPISGKPRSFGGVKYHIEKTPPYDYRVLKGYADDLNVSIDEVLVLFGVVPEYNFEAHLKELGFTAYPREGKTELVAELPSMRVAGFEYLLMVKEFESETIQSLNDAYITCDLFRFISDKFIGNEPVFTTMSKPKSRAVTEFLFGEYLKHLNPANT